MGDIISDLFGDTKETSVSYLPEQIKDIQETNKFKTDVMMPTYKDYIGETRDVYERSLPGMYKAAQGGAGYAGQVGETLGGTGEAAARSGISGYQSFLDPNYGREQFAAAMAPIQGQYQQNLANQGAMFGGAGQLGSSRQALAGAQAATGAQAAQMQAAADVMKDINQQRLMASQGLTGAGRDYLTAGLGARQAQLGFAERPMDWVGQAGKNLGYVPGAMYTPQYPGTQGTTTTSTESPLGIAAKIFGKF